MNDAATMKGHCLCGAVAIELVSPADTLEICQCAMCRRWGGAFYAAQTGESFTIAGEQSIATYKSSEWGERAFCKTCGSNLWWRFLPTGNRSFSAGLFDGAVSASIAKEIFSDERADWCRLIGDHPRQTGAQVIAEAKEAGFDFD